MIPESSHIVNADLRVKNLERSLDFYADLLGLKEKFISDKVVELYSNTGGRYLIKLCEEFLSTYPDKNNAGLYHIAIKLPGRKELAKVFMRLFNQKYKFQGFSDHLVSESIYLSDPEENGIELYADKPEGEWEHVHKQIVMDTLPLDLSSITKEIGDDTEWKGIHPDTTIGHIHLKGTNLKFADMFYNRIMGFNVSNSSYSGAVFFAAGSYHHHIGVNTWHSKGGQPQPDNALGLISYTISVPDRNYLEHIEKKSAKENLLIKNLGDDDSLIVKDFDNIKIRLTL